MKKIKLSLFLLLFILPIFAQNIEVKSFEHLETDLTANSSGSIVYDQNGEKCALIKIRCNPYTKGFTFDVGRLGVQELKMEGLEYWLYVPHGVRKISIQHEKLGFLDNYDFGMSVKKASTYLLTLSVNQAQQQEDEQIMEQYLVFSVEPKESLLEVDNIPWELADGFATKKLPFGTYEYRVIAADHHIEVGRVTLSNSEEKKVVDVKLRPAYGWLEIVGEGNSQDAVVYLDNKFMGKAPLVTDKIASGNHILKIVKNKYDVFEEKIVIADSDTLKMNPILTGNFIVMELKSMDGAEIWVNGEMKGVTSWKGEMNFGKYKVEARKDLYYPSVLSFELTSSDTIKSIVIPEPTPIYGKLDVVVTPNFSDVYVDGELMGQTPLFIPKLIIGNHIIEVRKDGKASVRKEISIREGELFNLSGELRNGPVKVKIESPVDVNFYVDGKKRGFVSCTESWLGNIQVGKHEFEFRKTGYESQKMLVDIHYDNQSIIVPELHPYLYEVACYVLPDSSDIYIDKQHMGVTPLLLKLPMGMHQVEISKYGMLPLKKVVNVTEGSNTLIVGELKKATKKEMEDLAYTDVQDAEYIVKFSRWDSINSLTGYNKTMQKFYYTAGKYEFTTLRVAGNFANDSYNVDASLFDFRLKMLEFSLLNFSLTGDYYEQNQYLSYCPSLRLHIPLTSHGTMFFGVAPVVAFSEGYITDIFYRSDSMVSFQGDFGFRIDSGRAFGVDFFARYRYEQGFSAGLAIHFSTNGKRARDMKK